MAPVAGNAHGSMLKKRANASICFRFRMRLPESHSEIDDSAAPVACETSRITGH